MRRRIALMICRAAGHLLPRAARDWSSAIAAETAAIDDDGEALAFAIGSLRGLIGAVVADHFLRPRGVFSNGEGELDVGSGGLRVRAIGMLCGVGSVSCGLGYMAAAGAPTRYLLLNAAALAIGLTLAAMARILRGRLEPWSGSLVLAIGLALLATALLGDRAEGAARWVTVGAVFVQPSLVLLPVAIMAFARGPGLAGASGMLVAALALALQPDRAMAAMLFVSTTLLAVMRPGRNTVSAFVSSTLALAATLGRGDNLPAVSWVDQILYSAFDVHPVAGAAVLFGSALLVLPAILGWFGDEQDRSLHIVFGAIWAAAIGAAALGNYPTPVVGYGGSAVIGYLLSVAVLPGRSRRGTLITGQPDRGSKPTIERHLRTAIQAG